MTASQTALLVTTDTALASGVRRVAAAADRTLDEVSELNRRAQWDEHAVVMLDAPAAFSVVEQRLPRRPGVVVVLCGEAGLDHWRAAAAVGAEHVVALPTDEDSLVALLAVTQDDRGRGDGGVIAVMGGCGGAGASTFAAALALHPSERRRILLDADGAGGGLDLVLGWEERSGLRWPDLVLDGGRVAAEALHHALPVDDGLALVSVCRESSTPLSPRAAAAVVDAGRSAGDLVVCDVPRHVDDVADTLIEFADLVVLVVPARVRAGAAAGPVAERLRAANANVGVVVRGPSPGGLRAADIGEMLHLPVIVGMRPERGLDAMLDRTGLTLGRRSPLAAAAEAVLTAFEAKPVSAGWSR
ncbi:septum site-determining protein Ssd [Actinomycetes bacterium M1A6_2h]